MSRQPDLLDRVCWYTAIRGVIHDAFTNSLFVCFVYLAIDDEIQFMGMFDTPDEASSFFWTSKILSQVVRVLEEREFVAFYCPIDEAGLLALEGAIYEAERLLHL